MRSPAAVLLAAAAVLLMLVEAAPPQCIKEQQACVRASECCTGCCNEGKCVRYAEACTAGNNPCSLHECPPEKKCYLHQVQCVAAPCHPVPACRDQHDDYHDYEE